MDAAAKFGVKAMKQVNKVDARDSGKQLDAEKVLKAARKVTSNAANDESSEMSAEEDISEQKSKSNAKKAVKQ